MTTTTTTPPTAAHRRIQARVQALVETHYRRASSRHVGGQNAYQVSIRPRGERRQPSAETETTTIWKRRHRGPNWAGLNATFRISDVPSTWSTSVYAEGLEVVGGLVTLSLRRLHQFRTPDRATVYRATWIEQGRGLSIRAVHGFLALGREYHYHSTESATHALSGLRRKQKRGARAGAVSTRELRALLLADPVHRDSRSLRFLGLEVTVEDSAEAGNCAGGTRSFCHRHLDGRRSATVRELAAVLKSLGRSERLRLLPDVERACLAAMRSQRRSS